MKLHATAVVFLLFGTAFVSLPLSSATKCTAKQLQPEILSIDATRMTIKYMLKTYGTEGKCILKWNLMLDDDFWQAAVEVHRKQGGMIKYDSPVIPFHYDIDDGDYTFIPAGSTVTKTRDLSQYFSFIKDAEYSLKVKLHLLDCYHVKKAQDCKSRKSNSWNIIKYESLLTEFKATVKKDAPKKTIDAWVQEDKNRPTLKTESPKVAIYGGSEDEHNAIIAAHKLANRYFTSAVSVLKKVKTQLWAMDMFENWFGTFDEERFKQVLGNFQECVEENNNIHLYNRLTGNDLCPTRTIAYVWAALSGKKEHGIQICDPFFGRSLSAQAQTLAHERTHDTARTKDKELNNHVCYGENKCRDLATAEPDSAIASADNYAFFAWEADVKENP